MLGGAGRQMAAVLAAFKSDEGLGVTNEAREVFFKRLLTKV